MIDFETMTITLGYADLFLLLFLFFSTFLGLASGAIFAFYRHHKLENQEKQKIQKLVSTIPDEQRPSFYALHRKTKKKAVTAILLALLLGWMGAHQFYLGRPWRGVLYLLFFWTYIPVLLTIIDLFKIPAAVSNQNLLSANETAVLHGGVRCSFLLTQTSS